MSTNKRRRHTSDQIIRELAEGNKLSRAARTSMRCADTSRSPSPPRNRWLDQYGGMKADDAKRLKNLEAENAQLKKLVANQALDIDMLKDISSGNF